MSDLHPILPLGVAAALMPLVGVTGRRLLALAAPLAALLLLLAWPEGATWGVRVLGHDLTLLRMDGLGRLYGLAFTLYGAIAGLYAWHDTGAGAKAASLGLVAGGVGVVLAGDLLALFLFWELLTVCSLFLVWLGGTAQARAAGLRYALFHLAGGLCLLAGTLLLGGDRALGALPLEGAGAWLVLIGVLTNAAVPPLHAWLPDAYPRASIFGSVFLAAFTTKAAVCILARLFPGTPLLVWVGAVMTVYGVVFALLANDLRQLLAYHIVSQVGYMVCGVGLGGALGLGGSAAHAFTHIFYKGLLLMAAGAVVYATGRGKLSELGRLAGPLRWTMGFYLIGAFSISGVPPFSGFVSKSMVVSAAGYAGQALPELLLLVASVGTFLCVGLKAPWLAFGGADHGAEVRRAVPLSMAAAMGAASGICIVVGLAPGLLYAWLPYAADYHPYTADHLVTAVQLLAGTTLAFWLLRAKLVAKAAQTFDVDQVYRRPLPAVVAGAGAVLQAAGRGAEWMRNELIAAAAAGLHRADRRLAEARLSQRLALILLVLAGVGYLVVYVSW